MNFELAPDLTHEEINSLTDIYRWYHEKVRGSDALVITVGDSWTWGGSLPPESRLDLVYGNLLADKFSADFVNLAACAWPNWAMHKWLSWFLPQVVQKYKRIFVAITLTENGREILDWTNWLEQTSTVPKNLVSFQIEYEQAMFKDFRSIFEQYPQVKVVVGRNFTYTYDENKSVLADYLVSDIWVDRLAIAQNMMDYPKNVRVLTWLATKPLIAHFKKFKVYKTLKPEFFEDFMAMTEAIEWLERSSLNCHGREILSKHPIAEGHQLWADYLEQHLLK
jgi:hypothetical protein